MDGDDVFKELADAAVMSAGIWNPLRTSRLLSEASRPLSRVAVTHQRDVISDRQAVCFALTSARCMNHLFGNSMKAIESFCK